MKTDIDLAFCDTYRYPQELKDILERIARAMDPDAIRSAILLGSTSRGEFSWRKTGGQFVPLSDVEFLLVTRDTPKDEALKNTFDALSAIEQEIGAGAPLFHIDCSPVTEEQLKKLPPIFRNFETKTLGKVLYGEPLLDAIPEISLENLDWRDLNEILIWRLWAIWLYMPLEFFAGKTLTKEADRAFAHIVSRNLLDLPSWLLPRSGHLLGGFGPRLKKLEEIWDSLPEKDTFGDDLQELLQKCLLMKLGKRKPQNVPELYRQTMNAYHTAWASLADKQGKPDKRIEQTLERNSRHLFLDWHWRRKGHEMRTILKTAGRARLVRVASWLSTPKYGPMLSLLVYAHQAIQAYPNDKELAKQNNESAYRILNAISLRNPSISSWQEMDFPDHVRFLRRGFADFLCDYFPSVATKRSYLETLL